MSKKKKKNELKGTFKNLIKSWRFIRNQKLKLFGCLIFSALLCLISVVTPLLSAKLLLNLTDGIFENVTKVATVILIIELTRNICNFFYSRMFHRYLMDTISEMQCVIAEETLKLETEELDKKSSGIFIDRLNNDTREIVNIFNQLGDALIDVVTNVGVLMAVFVVNKIMFFYFVITCTVIFILEKIRMKKMFEIDKKRRKIAEKNTGLIGELVRGIRDIKVLNANTNFMNKAKERLREANEENYKMEKVRMNYRLAVGTIKDIFNIAFIYLGIYLVTLGNLTVANFVVIYMYKDRIVGLLGYFTFVIELLKKFNIAADRVFEVVDDGYFKKEKFGTKNIKKVKGDFEFKNVTFAYDDSKKVLKDISFKVNANETVAFVGKSGSGKSTIFSLINKLYNIDEGEILIDGININDLSKDSLRNNMSIITQNPYIFNFSIKENLKLVKENMTDEEMIEVCKTACLHDFIMTLPDGYDTLVGEGGLTLSGGQRQRLAIARALLKKTEIILFDEATSALDNETQDEIQKAINNMKGEYTILIIAHRLSTVIDSDRIIMIEDGKVIDEGTHEKLLKSNEAYQKLYRKELI